MSCPACGSAVAEALTEKTPSSPFSTGAKSYRLHRCIACRSEFAEPRTEAPEGWYHHVDEFYGWRWEFDEVLATLRARSHTKRVLEIGCGEGLLLERLSSEYEAGGIDKNAQAVDAARRKGLRVDLVDLRDFVVDATARFDAILFFHVLEHVEDPLHFLRTVRAVLAPNGMILLSVPNERRLSLLVRRESWDHPPHHLTRFSRIGLLRLLERAGFRVSSIRDQPLDVSTYRWAATYANQVIRRLGVGEPMDWPTPLRLALKLAIVPVVYLQALAQDTERITHCGPSLLVEGSLE